MSQPFVDTRSSVGQESPPVTGFRAAGGVVVLIASERLGQGDDALGATLMVKFLDTLMEVVPQLTALVLLNGGVKLTVRGTPTVDALQRIADCDVPVLACGTCVDYFDLRSSLAVGTVSNMFDIVTLLAGARQVIRP